MTTPELAARARVEAPTIPPSEKVWSICHYIDGRSLKPCERCPEWEEHEKFGRVMRSCYAMAREVVNIVETGNPWRHKHNAD